MKEITIEQLEVILKEYCVKNKLKFREIKYDPKYKWILFIYEFPKKSEYFHSSSECYCMSLDDDFRFISVKRGLAKQLMRCKIVGIDKIKKNEGHVNWG
jgi:hypothetical protein